MTDAKVLSTKLGVCEVCGTHDGKYVCPKCEVKTCTLKCVTIHKKELNCNGIRDPTKFIPLNSFTNVDLLNDFRMLEQADGLVQTLHKVKKPYEFRGGRRILPKPLTRLKSALHQQDIIIKFLPETFQKRINNKTFLHRSKNLVFWDIEWVFPNADGVKTIEHGCKATSSLCALLHKYLSGDELTNKLNFYQSAGASGVTLLLKAENVPGNKYYELDQFQSIQENLAGKTIVEYPTILVILKGHEGIYNIMSEMEELPEPVQKKPVNEGDVVITQLLNEAAKDERPTSNNLLFITEYSDAELSTDEDMT